MTKKHVHKKRCLSPSEILHHRLLKLLLETEDNPKLPDDIPTKWEKHGDLILLPAYSFRDKLWFQYGDKLWNIVSDSLKCSRLARKNPICNDNYRSPNIELLKGSDTWVMHIDNRIRYAFDASKCMFSAGNISEKLRISRLSCEGETVVDLYAGIGYFTLPFLIHAKASKVHACEWNPHAVEALSRNLTLNNVTEKCTIHFGDNREVCPRYIADRVNLGLIPTSEDGWETACRALKPVGGILHVHGTVTSNICSLIASNSLISSSSPVKPEWDHWANNSAEKIASILFEVHKNNWNVTVVNIFKIKSYAPHIDHLVIDLFCQPNKSVS